MANPEVRIDVRGPAEGILILDIQGPLTASAEEALSAAFTGLDRARTLVLNFTRVPHADSLGLGLLIAMLARDRKHRGRWRAYGLSEPIHRAFRLTHLDEVVRLCADEAEALGRPSLASPPSKHQEVLSGAGLPAPAIPQPGTWATPVERFSAPPLPKGVICVNTEGRRLTGPVKGFGSLWRRTYTVRLTGAEATPFQVIRVWKERFATFWPPSGRFYGADKPIEAGDRAVLNLSGPAGLTIATGIRVIYADSESFCFISAEGHMMGGMITFRAYQENGTTVAQVQALLRASDPLFEVTVRLGIATRPEDRFWLSTLKNLAAHFGAEGQTVSQEVVRLDPRLQWAEAKGIWYNGAIRSALYTPVRWLRGQGAR